MRVRSLLTVFIIMMLWFFQSFLAAGTAAAPRKTYVTNHINPHPPTIDGVLDDPVWKKGEWSGNFIQRFPYEGKKPTEETSFQILYDKHNLYIAIRAHDSSPDKIAKMVTRRDNIDGDWVCVNIDSYHDRRTASAFYVNAAGTRSDAAVTEDGGNRDMSWDPVWHAKTAVTNDGWTAEMQIPFSQLRFANNDAHTWGLQFTRSLFRRQEESTWQFVPQTASGWVNHFGELKGLKNIKSRRGIELTPYTVGNIQTYEAETGNPFADGRSKSLTGGLDGKFSLSSDLTLDFTINPDFGQVEADPSEVNLTTTETYLREKRPFFVEGRNILNFNIMDGDGGFSSDTPFYSRRIGRPPQYSPDLEDDQYMDMPDTTTILAAFKLTGKTRNGLSIGILDSLTARERVEIDTPGGRGNETAEPLTNYFVLRLQKDYNRGNTQLGGIVTTTHRDNKDPHLDFLHKSAYSGGLDFSHQWKNKTYFLNARAIFSHVRGDKEAILRDQESPLRYYQRPDAGHLSIDPDRTSLSGHGGTIAAGKGGNGRLRYSGGVTWRSPGLELNDMGYLRGADRIMQWVWAGYRISKPFALFNMVNFNANQWQGWDFSGEHLFNGGNFSVYAQFKNYWGIDAGYNVNGGGLSTSALRGGPALRFTGRQGVWVTMNSDNRKSLHFNANISDNRGNLDATHNTSYRFSTTYRPGKALSVSLAPRFSYRRDNLQYVDTLDSGGESRYVFGTIEQRTLAVTLRLNYSITPELSIQFYGQPFIASGKYRDFKIITNPRSDNFHNRFHTFNGGEIAYDAGAETYNIDENADNGTDYSFENPDFNFLQFRSNLVLRWEYSPGSTVFLVWSQGRTFDGSAGEFSFEEGMNDLFRTKPHNVFLVKFTYRFNL